MIDLTRPRSSAPARIAFVALFVAACALALACATCSQAYAASPSLQAGEEASYEIVYHLNGGTQAKKQRLSVTEDATIDIGEIKSPSRRGYAFKGWYVDSDLSERAEEVVGTSSESERTLYAKWELKSYSIKLKPGKGKLKASYPHRYTMKSRSIALPKPVRIGYRFMGWFKSKSSKKRVTKVAHGSMGNKVFYAKWAPIVYSIAYFTDGGTLGKNSTKRFSRQNTRVRIPDPKKKGYAFMGWYSDAKKTKRVFSISPKSKGNKILYAKWRKRELVAHRGYFAGGAVENSAAAFKAAKKKGFKTVEMDVRFTKDGVPIVFHDERIQITRVSADGRKVKVRAPIGSLTYEELQTAKKSGAISGSDGNNVATFEEMLGTAKSLKLNVCIHLKTSREAQLQTLIEGVEKLKMSGRVTWVSTFFDALAYVEEWYGADAKLMYMHSITKEALKDLDALRADGADVVLLRHESLLTDKGIEACKAAGIPLGTWGFENEKDALAVCDPYISVFMLNGLKAKRVPELVGK